MLVEDLSKGDLIIHPTTGERVKVRKVRHLNAAVKVYFGAKDVAGWFKARPGHNIKEQSDPD